MTDPNPLQRLNASIWFFRGSTLLVLSIIGEYVGRIYRNLNRAPQFIVREELLCVQGATPYLDRRTFLAQRPGERERLSSP